ncbi:MAG: AraC family transcriptional regulator [Chitinophagaceae bacterium]|uniref:AraC family transcriptional regulator n=1 Tax=unclassified Paraflavitalea TaxID=2798305 RepID=UPI003D33C6A7|nr:AraC family transcriptional regulator [Chitinophagaceae bacterium]
MKPFVEKLKLSDDQSFLASFFRTPQFEVPLHQHPEIELILLTEGSGIAYIGDYIGPYKVGELYLIGANLPHCFQRSELEKIGSAIVVQFLPNLWGEDFLKLPETQPMLELFESAQKGIKLSSDLNAIVVPLMHQLKDAKDLLRFALLQQCLHEIIEQPNHTFLCTTSQNPVSLKHQARIDQVFKYTQSKFQEPIGIDEVAAHVGMTAPAFCSYFKKSTKKTYTNFLNELRIGYACKLLIESRMPIHEICYESGYNTIAHFNKQFLKIKHATPLQFRKQFQEQQKGRINSDSENRVLSFSN